MTFKFRGKEYEYIKLPNGKKVKVDIIDYYFFNQWKWHDYDGYAARTVYLGGGRKNAKYKMVKLHREIMANPEGYQVDHINGDKYDNRRCNLRLATNSQNQMNKGLQKNNTSGHTGVQWVPKWNRWMARIIKDKKRIYLGAFKTKEEAIMARKVAEKIYFNNFAKQ